MALVLVMRMYDDGLASRGLNNGAFLVGSIRAARQNPESSDLPTLQVASVHEPNGPGSESLASDWVTRRSCADTDPNVFFPSDGAGVIAAQKVCAECPVKDPCREYALANNITHGVWGGTSERQRRRILRDRRRAGKSARAA
ncbi:WhiB family transcriptional regulator [Candidatus Poriferisodalis sp.]|uniref:WhiB family transcriptional regulator n=2 Tax=Candidatus Poriferisodalis sp. TaxID=3101277 RepID=UPI003B59CEF2